MPCLWGIDIKKILCHSSERIGCASSPHLMEVTQSHGGLGWKSLTELLGPKAKKHYLEAVWKDELTVHF